VTFRLYLSASEVADEQARRFFEGLKSADYTLIWSRIGQAEHTTIGPTIAACDAVVAVANGVWNTSTYHSMEISYALGDASYENQPPLDSPRPVLVYVDDQEWSERHWIQREIEIGRVERLPADADEAIARIDAVLRGRA
jgi:hypothetical protein